MAGRARSRLCGGGQDAFAEWCGGGASGCGAGMDATGDALCSARE
jgi:hypothetical protein